MTRSPSPFIVSISRFMAVRHYSPRTIETYLYWIKHFIYFHNKRHPQEMGDLEVERFLTFLAVERGVSMATQKLALNALAFLYNRFLNKSLGGCWWISAIEDTAKVAGGAHSRGNLGVFIAAWGCSFDDCVIAVWLGFAAYGGGASARQRYRF